MSSLWLAEAPPIRTDPLPARSSTEVVVVGGGITGLVTGYLLALDGAEVTLLEARHLGATTTGHTTGKVSVLQGTKASQIAQQHGPHTAQDYLARNRDGQTWLHEFCSQHKVPIQETKAVTWADDIGSLTSLRTERDLLRAVGLDAHIEDSFEELPFATYGGVVLPGQFQFDPMDLVAALAQAIRQLGGTIHEDARVHDVATDARVRVRVNGEEIEASYVVIATGMPILDRGLHAARMEPHRSYCLAWSVDGELPDGMDISTGGPTVSLRQAPRVDRTLLIVGGHGHVVGRTKSELDHLDALRRWTRQHFGNAEEEYWWSAQDLRPASRVPFVGFLPMSNDRVLAATGYDKWGMTNAVSAAFTLAAAIAQPRIKPATLDWNQKARSVPELLRWNLSVGGHLGADHLKSRLGPAPSSVSEGTGEVGRDPKNPASVVAVSQVNGRNCAVSAMCTHLGGVVRWNDAEKSWDCPLHGSRFAPDGTVLEGPATRPLAARPAANPPAE